MLPAISTAFFNTVLHKVLLWYGVGFFEYLTRNGVHGSVKDVSDTHYQCFCFEKLSFLQMLFPIYSVHSNPNSLLFP
jgi:hypothetical protein